MEFINGFLNVHSLVSFVLGLLPGGFFAYRLVRFLVRKEVRLFKNLQRKVYFLRVADQPTMQREIEMATRSGLFTLHPSIVDVHRDGGVLEMIDPAAVIVVGYSPTYCQYEAIVERARRHSIPLIVFAESSQITVHMPLFRGYPYFEMCNTSTRLLSTIFNICAVTPYAKK